MKKLLLLLAICLLAGCSKGDGDENPTPPDPPKPENVKIPINISTGVWSRATDVGFESGDKTGIYVVNYSGSTSGVLANSGNHVDNMRFSYTTKWTPDSDIYWKDQTTKADFYCYYPHVNAIANVGAYPFSLKADQSVDANYKASDFLWGKTANVSPTSDPINITANHSMSNLLIYMAAGDGYTDATLKAALKGVKVCNTKTNATINLATGVATPTGAVAEISPRAESDHYRALIVPQSVTDVELIKITVGDETFSLRQTLTFEANKQHKCTLTVNRTGSGINIGIGGWDTDDADNGGSVE